MAVDPKNFMHTPNESLEDFMKPASARKPAGPPPERRLRGSGVLIMLKPLALSEQSSRRESGTREGPVRVARSPGGYRFSWFHRSLAAGGAFALIAILFGIGILIGIYGSHADWPAGSLSDVDAGQQTETSLPSQKGHDAGEFPADNSSRSVSGEFRVIRPALKRRAAAVRTFTAVHLRPRPLRRSKFVVTKFVPTKLIIYPENGQIKTRIEPQLTSEHKSIRQLRGGV